MAKRKIRRSAVAHQRKVRLIWIVSLFFLALLVLLDVVIVYNQVYPPDRALSEEVDYSKIHFEGLSLGDKITPELKAQRVIDAEFDYSYKNIAISVDNDDVITRLGFYTTEPINNNAGGEGTNINNVIIDYRDYPLKTISDFVTYFGYTKITNFRNYKYLTYQDTNYAVDITLVYGEIYNVELYKK